VDFGLVDDREPMAPVERPHRVPLEISKPKQQSTGVRDGKTVGQDPGSQTLPLMGWEQVELIKTQMIGNSRERDGTNGFPIVHDPREWRILEPLLMEVSLERLIPSPSGYDVGAYGCPFDLKSQVPCLERMRKAIEADVRGQVRNIHQSTFW
jgi:hypothetical protein